MPKRNRHVFLERINTLFASISTQRTDGVFRTRPLSFLHGNCMHAVVLHSTVVHSTAASAGQESYCARASADSACHQPPPPSNSATVTATL